MNKTTIALAVILLFTVAGCARGPEAPPMAVTPIAAEKLFTSGTAPDMYSVCWKNKWFLTTSGKAAGIVQVMDDDGKPLKCNVQTQ